jgi:cytochrome c-type biogenesis protein CcmF
VITSVHAFANDPERGVFILAILAVFMGGALTLFAARASAMEAKGIFGMVSRESVLVLNNVLLAVACFVVFIGTIWPLVSEMFFARKLSVGAPFFNMAFTPFMVVLGIILPVGAMLPWKRANVVRAAKPLVPAFVLAVAIAGLAWSMQTEKSLLGPVGLFLGAWLVFGALVDVYSRTGRGGFGQRLGRLSRLPRADWGTTIAHGGLGITMLGSAGLRAWAMADIRGAYKGQSFEVGAYEFTLDDVREVAGPNYTSTMGDVTVRRNGEFVALVNPEKRVYPVQAMPTTEAAIDYRFLRDVYVVIGDAQNDGGYTMRVYIKPLTNWIWMGCFLMSLGGVVSLSDRRYRVAAGARKAPNAGVPAE